MNAYEFELHAAALPAGPRLERHARLREPYYRDTSETTTTARTARNGTAISLAGVSKRFGERQVLHDVDLQVSPGQFFAVVGRSGCGKSTLLRILAGLEHSDGSTPIFDGTARSEQNDDTRFMFQDARLLPWKRVVDNVAIGLTQHQGVSPRDRALLALAQVGLADRAGDWPSVLSGGQRQRVALARALVHRPRLLLLDEPLGALDALTRIEMHRLIETLWTEQRFTAILVTHDVAEAVALADRVVLIDAGRIALDEAVRLPRPRTRGADFDELEAKILQRVLGEAAV
ncbi:aliphatic sulfonates ABC transporter ATP-binding protein [soil metagenome]